MLFLSLMDEVLYPRTLGTPLKWYIEETVWYIQALTPESKNLNGRTPQGEMQPRNSKRRKSPVGGGIINRLMQQCRICIARCK